MMWKEIETKTKAYPDKRHGPEDFLMLSLVYSVSARHALGA